MKNKIFNHKLLIAGTIATLGLGFSTGAQAEPEAHAIAIQLVKDVSIAFSGAPPLPITGEIESVSECSTDLVAPDDSDGDTDSDNYSFPPPAPVQDPAAAECNVNRGPNNFAEFREGGTNYGSGDALIDGTDLAEAASMNTIGESYTSEEDIPPSVVRTYSGGGRNNFSLNFTLEQDATMTVGGEIDYRFFSELIDSGPQSLAIASTTFRIQVFLTNPDGSRTLIGSIAPPELNQTVSISSPSTKGNENIETVGIGRDFDLAAGLYEITVESEVGSQVKLDPPPPVVVFGDHYLCYKSFGSFLRQEVNLVDQFDNVNFDVLKPKMFCNPAIKPILDPEAFIENPEAHLLSYKINEAHREPRHERQTVLMRDQFFSALAIQTVNPDRLMVPSGKSLDGSMPTDPAGAINHFKCYRVRTLTGFQEISVNIADQFTDDIDNLIDPLNADVEIEGKDLVLVRPTRMCTPVDKNSEGIVVNPDADPADPRDHLMCYRVKAERGARLNRRTEVTSNNQFRDEDLVLKRELEFCAPATKTVINGTPDDLL